MADQGGKRDDAPRPLRTTDRVFAGAENVVYGGIALLLVVTALVLLVQAAGQLLSIRNTPVQDVTIQVLDTLLLVFIVVELLFAVRATLVKRELVAEPFLLVGIIASIKEIVVLSVKAAEQVGKGAVFNDQVKEIAVLGVLVLLLAIAAWLLRLKEREPDEGDSPADRADRDHR
jgi:divalent metal cation (Fe/Co/Zn/Cd) transporter